MIDAFPHDDDHEKTILEITILQDVTHQYTDKKQSIASYSPGEAHNFYIYFTPKIRVQY
jgi:hypothetical protein